MTKQRISVLIATAMLVANAGVTNISFVDKQRMKKLAATELTEVSEKSLYKAVMGKKCPTVKVAISKKPVTELSIITKIADQVGKRKEGFPLFVYSDSLMPNVIEEIQDNGMLAIAYLEAGSRMFKSFLKFLNEQKSEGEYVVCYLNLDKTLLSDGFGSAVHDIATKPIKSYMLKDWASVEMYEKINRNVTKNGPGNDVAVELVADGRTFLEMMHDDSGAPFVIKAKLRLTDAYFGHFYEKGNMYYAFDLEDSTKMGRCYIRKNAKGKELYKLTSKGEWVDALVKLRFVPSVPVGDSNRDHLFLEDYKILKGEEPRNE